MSVVAVRKYEDRVEIASDDILVSGNLKIGSLFSQKTKSKLYKVRDIYVGAVGIAEITQNFKFYIEIKKIPNFTVKGISKYIYDFRKWFITTKREEENGIFDSSLILVKKDKLFTVDLNDIVVEQIKEYYAIGIGREIALGALYVGATPTQAVESAIMFVPKVSGEIITKIIKL